MKYVFLKCRTILKVSSLQVLESDGDPDCLVILTEEEVVFIDLGDT